MSAHDAAAVVSACADAREQFQRAHDADRAARHEVHRLRGCLGAATRDHARLRTSMLAGGGSPDVAELSEAAAKVTSADLQLQHAERELTGRPEARRLLWGRLRDAHRQLQRLIGSGTLAADALRDATAEAERARKALYDRSHKHRAEASG